MVKIAPETQTALPDKPFANRVPAKAGRSQVLAAADAILLEGRRPTIEGIQERLSGGSPTSIVAYLKDWYAGLAQRLAAAEEPAEGLSPEIHQAALTLQQSVRNALALHPQTEVDEALHRSLRAEIQSLRVLVNEIQMQRSRDQQAIADARALLLRRDEELGRLNGALMNVSTELAIMRDRLRSRAPAHSTIKRSKKRKARLRKTTKPSRNTSTRKRKRVTTAPRRRQQKRR